MTITSKTRYLKTTLFLSKRENGLVACQIEAKTQIKTGISQQKLARGAKNGCFTNMQSFVTIACSNPYYAHYFWDNSRIIIFVISR